MEHAQNAFHPKICILSAAGGCGKTTLAVNLFQPFLHDPHDFHGSISRGNTFS